MLNVRYTFDELGASYDRTRQLDSAITQKALATALASAGVSSQSAVLEIGCGTGQLLEALAGLGVSAHGVDPSPAALEVCAERTQRPDMLCVADGRRLPFLSGAFDLILIAHVLEHVERWTELVEEAWRVTRAAGSIIFLFSPGFVRNAPRSRIKRLLRERGVSIARPGLASRSELVEYLARTRRRMTRMSNPDWSWQRSVPFRLSLSALSNREYSLFWRAPDEDYVACVKQVENEFADRSVANETEAVSVSLELWICKRD